MESRSVIYIGSLNYQLFNAKLYLTIITNTDDYLPMSEVEILAQETYEHKEQDNLRKMTGNLDSKDFTTGNLHHLIIAKERGLQLFEMVKSILQNNDIILLYCLFGTHVYPVAISKEITHWGMHNYLDDLERGLSLRIERAPNDQKLTLTLLKLMLPHLTMHSGISYVEQNKFWFPKTYVDD